MFENSLVDQTLNFNRGRRLAVLPLSAAAHVAVLVGVLYVSAMHVEMPTAPPARMQPFEVMVAPPPMTAPLSIPSTIPPAQPATPVASAGSEGGDPLAAGPVGVPTGVTNGTGTNPDATGGPGATGSGTKDTPLQVRGNVLAPVIITRVDPHYPELLLHIRMKGSAIVECVVDATGRVQSVVPISSTHKLFEASAVEAVRKWTFRPGSVEGRPVPTIFRLTVTFEPR